MRNDALEKPRIVLIEDNPSDVYLMGFALEQSGLIFERHRETGRTRRS